MSDTPLTDAILIKLAALGSKSRFAEHARNMEREFEKYKARCRRADQIILMLTADHNTGQHYVKGFDMAQEYFQDFPND